jgi:hypothetical protein
VTSPRPWTEEDDATLRRLHGSGLALHSISKEMKRAKDTVSKKAAALGLSFDRTVTAAATHAARVDAKSRQATLELGLLTDVEKSRLMFGGIETMRDFQAFEQGLDATVRAYANFKRTIPTMAGWRSPRASSARSSARSCSRCGRRASVGSTAPPAN